MRRTFPFHDLSDDEFENLIAAICNGILGTGTIVFATGKDGGRDAKFMGTAAKFPSINSPLAGRFIIQSKHTANPAASCSDKEFSRLVEGEKSKIKSLIDGNELEHYLIFTNRKKPANGTIKIEKQICELGVAL